MSAKTKTRQGEKAGVMFLILSGRLPMDVERVIMETTAMIYPSSRITLLLVARRVHAWIEPYLYDTITITPKNVFHFMQYALVRRPPKFFARYVRTLCVCADVEPTSAARILAICTGAENVACWVRSLRMVPSSAAHRRRAREDYGNMTIDAGQHGFPFKHLRSSALKRVSISLDCCFAGRAWPGPVFDISDLPGFGLLTHLEVLDGGQCPARRPMSGFHRLPNLTHLALDAWGTLEELAEILKGCKHLKVLLLLAGDRIKSRCIEDFLCIRGHGLALDPRLVVLPINCVTSDWEGSVQGNDDAWTEAERLIESRATVG